MDLLNYECMEHIAGFLGPKEWAVLSKVCTKWHDVLERFWRRLTRLEISDDEPEHNPQYEFLRTVEVIDILKYTVQHVTEIDITKCNDICNIKFGNYSYNLNDLNVLYVEQAFLRYSSGQIVKANVLADEKEFFMDYLFKWNKNLKEVQLTMTDRKALDDYDTFAVKVYIETLVSFPKLESFTVMLKWWDSFSNEAVVNFNNLFSSLTHQSLDYMATTKYYWPNRKIKVKLRGGTE